MLVLAIEFIATSCIVFDMSFKFYLEGKVIYPPSISHFLTLCNQAVFRSWLFWCDITIFTFFVAVIVWTLGDWHLRIDEDLDIALLILRIILQVIRMMLYVATINQKLRRRKNVNNTQFDLGSNLGSERKGSFGSSGDGVQDDYDDEGFDSDQRSIEKDRAAVESNLMV